MAYAKDPGHIRDVQRRNVVADDATTDVGPRVFVVLEEANATFDLLAQYWAEPRALGEPKRSPAATALAFTLFTVRAVRTNVVVAAQQLRADAVAGGATGFQSLWVRDSEARACASQGRGRLPEGWNVGGLSRVEIGAGHD